MTSCAGTRVARIVEAGTDDVRVGHWHGDVAVLDDGSVFRHGYGRRTGEDARVVREAVCGPAPHPQDGPPVTCQVTGAPVGSCHGTRCRHEVAAD